VHADRSEHDNQQLTTVFICFSCSEALFAASLSALCYRQQTLTEKKQKPHFNGKVKEDLNDINQVHSTLIVNMIPSNDSM
jgi:hypothetical protein